MTIAKKRDETSKKKRNICMTIYVTASRKYTLNRYNSACTFSLVHHNTQGNDSNKASNFYTRNKRTLHNDKKNVDTEKPIHAYRDAAYITKLIDNLLVKTTQK